MGLLQDIKNFYLTFKETSAPISPASGEQKIYIDSSDHKLKRVNSSGTVTTIEGGSGGGYSASGRLTLTSGTPVTTSDVTGAGTIYYTPYVGDQISLYSGSAWDTVTFTELSLALTITSGKNYDVFCYNNSGTATLELSAAWTNDTTRADALAYQNGILCKSGALTRRYLGTIRASGTNVTESSSTKRFVWNYYNRRLRLMGLVDGGSHSYGTATWRPWNNTTTNTRFEFVQGANEDAIVKSIMVIMYGNCQIDLADDSTTAPSTSVPIYDTYGGQISQSLTYSTVLSAGYHYLQAIEIAYAGSNFNYLNMSASLAG